MYGTIARITVKPGSETHLAGLGEQYDQYRIPGHIATYVYRMDDNPSEYWLAVVFDSKESYRANAESPEQDARYQDLRALLTGDPEWHDGEVVSSQVGGGA